MTLNLQIWNKSQDSPLTQNTFESAIHVWRPLSYTDICTMYISETSKRKIIEIQLMKWRLQGSIQVFLDFSSSLRKWVEMPGSVCSGSCRWWMSRRWPWRMVRWREGRWYSFVILGFRITRIISLDISFSLVAIYRVNYFLSNVLHRTKYFLVSSHGIIVYH